MTLTREEIRLLLSSVEERRDSSKVLKDWPGQMYAALHAAEYETTAALATKLESLLDGSTKQIAMEAIATKSGALEAFTEQELICLGMHFKMYHYQCVKGEIADWGKPCENCVGFEGCLKNWGRIAAKLQAQFGIGMTRALKRKPYACVLKI